MELATLILAGAWAMGGQLSAIDREGIRREAAARLQDWHDQDGFLTTGVLDDLTVGRMRRIWAEAAGATKEDERTLAASETVCNRWRRASSAKRWKNPRKA